MPKRIMQGRVISTKGDKTVVVNVERFYSHPLYKKIVRRSKHYHAHDEQNVVEEGQMVQIQECPPKSKLKRWEVLLDAEGGVSKAKTGSEAQEAAAAEASGSN